MGIDDRKQRVLRAIVTLYGSAGEPVGSSLLAEYFDRAVSSATLRNEMAALTKLGLLEQPHTSAGRVPSAKGYRYYLDNLLDVPARLTAGRKAEIDSLFAGLDYDPEHLAEGAARALSQTTGYIAVATTPQSDDMCVAHYEVVQAGLSTAVVLAVTGAGGVRTRTVKLDFALHVGDTQRAAAALNRCLTFRNAADVNEDTLHAAADSLGDKAMLLYPILSAAVTLLREGRRASIYVEGQQRALDYEGIPEGSFRNLLALLSDPNAVRRVVNPPSPRTMVLLGDDVQDYPIPGLCIMGRRYLAGGGRTGAIALVGPTRMPYRDLIPQLEYYALLLGECMSGKGGNLENDNRG